MAQNQGKVPKVMERRKTMTMNWDGLADDDEDDQFFESTTRFSSAVPLDLPSSGSDDDEFEDSRLSFTTSSAAYLASARRASTNFRNTSMAAGAPPPPMFGDYDMWTAEPGSITERRKKLFQGMGLASSKNGLTVVSSKSMLPLPSKKTLPINNNNNNNNNNNKNNDFFPPVPVPIPVPGKPPPLDNDPPQFKRNEDGLVDQQQQQQQPTKNDDVPDSHVEQILLIRSRSDGDIVGLSADTRQRKTEMIGKTSKQRITRTSSVLVPRVKMVSHFPGVTRPPRKRKGNKDSGTKTGELSSGIQNGQVGQFFLIKNLDTDKEFIVKEFNENGTWNKLSEVQTGKQLTMEEFEKSVGHCPVVQDLMRRKKPGGSLADGKSKLSGSSVFSKSLRYSKRRGASLIKNIKGVANNMTTTGKPTDKDSPDSPPPPPAVPSEDQQTTKNNPVPVPTPAPAPAPSSASSAPSPSSPWVKVRSQGVSTKEFTALHLCQEIQAHESSIWSIKFSLDGHYLASAGEDRVIHVWEVQECDVLSGKQGVEDPAQSENPAEKKKDRPPLAELSPMPSEKKKKGKSAIANKGGPNVMPDYVHVPETMFSLSEKPVFSLTGHQDEVLDLSWSKSRMLLSSSMDKTVRLWDLETKTCLKTFAHNDYVTCIHFNPMNDDFFISGSLDEKVRIWSVPDRKLVVYADLHDMINAVCYNPDAQGAMVGTHSGNCRAYRLADSTLEQTNEIELQGKKKTKPKKITGFEFAPGNPTEVLVTSADSCIRVVNGTDVSQKFKGFKNTDTQISASFSPDGKYVICPSEDSQVYIWKRETVVGKSKGAVTITAHERFPCKDISVAVPWPESIKIEPPPALLKEEHTAAAAAAPVQSKLPPLPKKPASSQVDNSSSSTQEEDSAQTSKSESGTAGGESSSSEVVEPPPPSVSTEAKAAQPAVSVQGTAWGLVIVTASQGGEIRVYQNVGLPRKVGRQTGNIFST